MKALTVILTLTLASCGTHYRVSYVDPATGLVAGYSSKGGINIQYRPIHRDK